MKRDLYFKELAVVLGRAGFTLLPQENDSLPVEYQVSDYAGSMIRGMFSIVRRM